MDNNHPQATYCQLPTTNCQIELARRYVDRTGVSLFLTGRAGTGKTTFLHDVDAHCPKRHVVLAPTGVAAVNAGGVTIHSFFQLPFEPYLPDVKELVTEYQMPEARKSLSRNKIDIIRTLELLIIDEVSMVRADLLDAVDYMLRRYRRNSLPFGGVQLLMVGDVHQLAPVVTDSERPLIERVYPSPYFFESKALRRMNYVTIELQKVYRQQDERFVDLLNHVRDNNIDADTLRLLNSRVVTQAIRQTDDQAITLTTHNRQADAINRRHLEALVGKSRWFEALVEGNYPESMDPVERRLEVKEGERVMFTKNDSSGQHRYYNGKLATVTALYEEGVEVIDDDGETVQVGRERWENVRYAINAGNNEIEQQVEGSFMQLPLRPAWAVTIHKAQGLTFDRVAIDAADAFAFGQVYVALSRCRTLEGLMLTTPLSPSVAFNDRHVVQFVNESPTLEQATAWVPQYEQNYYYEQLTDLFAVDALLHDAESLQTVYSRLKAIYPMQVDELAGWIGRVAELDGVSQRFRKQLASMPLEQHPDRIGKGAAYYLAQLSQMEAPLMALLEVEIDNKENRKAVKETGERLQQRLGVKLAMLRVVKERGFDVEAVQKARTDALLHPTTVKRKRAAAMAHEPAVGEQEPLAVMLKQWRTRKSEELGVKAFHILQQKSLQAIVTYKPRTMSELLHIPGIGKVKAQSLGKEILDIVAEYGE